MSLDFDFRDIADHEALHADQQQLAISQTIALVTMGVGIGKIRPVNEAEFFARLDYLQRRDGGYLGNADGPYFVTASDIHRRVGLRTNVFPEESRPKWLKRVVLAEVGREIGKLARDYTALIDAGDPA